MYTRTVVSACLLLICGLSGFAQTPNVNLLRNSLKKSNADTGRVNLLLQLSSYYANSAKLSVRVIDSSMAYAKAAEKLSTSIPYPKGLGNSNMALAKALLLKKDSLGCNSNVRKAIGTFLKYQLYRDAAEAYLKLEEYYQAFGGTNLSVRIAYYECANPLFARAAANDRQEATLKILGDFYQLQGNYPKALQYLQQALALEQYVNLIDKESLYDLLGAVYAMTGNLNKALEYGLLAIKMVERGKDTTMQACAVYNRVGITYYQMYQPLQAKLFFEKALIVAVKCRDVGTQINENVNIARIMMGMGDYKNCIALLTAVLKKYPANVVPEDSGIDHTLLRCYLGLKQLKEARIFAKKLESYSLKGTRNTNNQQIAQSLLTEYYTATHQVKIAHKHLVMLKSIATAQHNPVAMGIAYTLQARLDSVENNFGAAYQHYKKAYQLKDSVWNENRGKKAAQLQTQFDAEKKEEQLIQKAERIKLLSSQARLQQLNLNQEKVTQKLIIAGAVLMIILLGLSYRGFRLKRRVNHRLQVQQEEIEQKNEWLTLLVNEKDHLLEEKEWLMKEIHHRVKNNLQIVISLLSTQSSYLDNDIAYNAIRESQHRMQSISLIHQKLYQSDNLALVDINAYITDLVDYLKESFDTGSRIEFETRIAAAELDVTRSVPLGLILNEAITNAIKYAFPDGRKGKICISLEAVTTNAFVLTIHDNGVGFPADIDISKSKSLGMSLMRGLSKQLGGSLKVENHDGITIMVDFEHENLLKSI